jgi:hypothetical protein
LGRDVYRVGFSPIEDWIEGDGPPWKGEALIDAREYQPVVVTTQLARKLPLCVRTVFGTDLRQLGFKVTYEPFGQGLWFPVSYGGEFDVRAVYFYKRRISLSLRNSGFRRADVTSTVSYGDALARSPEAEP